MPFLELASCPNRDHPGPPREERLGQGPRGQFGLAHAGRAEEQGKTAIGGRVGQAGPGPAARIGDRAGPRRSGPTTFSCRWPSGAARLWSRLSRCASGVPGAGARETTAADTPAGTRPRAPAGSPSSPRARRICSCTSARRSRSVDAPLVMLVRRPPAHLSRRTSFELLLQLPPRPRRGLGCAAGPGRPAWSIGRSPCRNGNGR